MEEAVWMFLAPFVLFIGLMLALGVLQLGLFIVGLVTRLGLFVLQIPFMIRRYGFQQTEREAALSRAANGTALLAAAVLMEPPIWVAVPLGVWGLAWMSTGYGWRSRGIVDGRLIQRYSIRLILGLVLTALPSAHPMLEIPHQLLQDYLVITGLVKLCLVLRGLPRQPDTQVIDQAVYGRTGFTRGDDK